MRLINCKRLSANSCSLFQFKTRKNPPLYNWPVTCPYHKYQMKMNYHGGKIMIPLTFDICEYAIKRLEEEYTNAYEKKEDK